LKGGTDWLEKRAKKVTATTSGRLAKVIEIQQTVEKTVKTARRYLRLVLN